MGVLWAYHSTWAFIVERDSEFREAYIASLGGPTDSHIIGNSDQISSSEDFVRIVEFWKDVDLRLALTLPTGNDRAR
jgi:hypothetical protein